jgi:2-octaprenyl-6-methoxyphenol hydroxylase
VAADGGNSPLRDLLGVAARRRAYQQCAVVCNLTPGRPHAQVAYERFTPAGPVALLPLADGRCGLVWTLPVAEAERVCGLDDDGFLAAVQSAFGYRLGRFAAVTPRQTFPLSLVRAAALTAPRAVLAGNAANQLHPVAGQGLNLGLRDAATLAELVVATLRRGGDPGAAGLLATYARRRASDHRAVVRFTDALARVFTVDLPLASGLRGAGLLALDLVPAAGRALARRAMGLAGRQPSLVRGRLP